MIRVDAGGVRFIVSGMPRFLNVVCLLLLAALPLPASELPPDVRQCLDSSSLSLEGTIVGPSGDCRGVLMNYMKGNWRLVLDNIDTIAPTDGKKLIMIRAGESLAPEDYMTFLESVRDLRAAQKIKDAVFAQALEPSSYKEGFLALNYNNPRVVRYIESLRALPPGGWTAGLADISSGRAQAKLLNRYSAAGTSFENKLLPSHSHLLAGALAVALVVILGWAVVYWKLQGRSAYYWRGDGN